MRSCLNARAACACVCPPSCRTFVRVLPSLGPSRHFIHARPPRLSAPQVFPFDLAWGPGGINSETLAQELAPQLFAFSLFPYLGFLYHLTAGRKLSGAHPMMVGGFYFLLVFVGATIPAGIYAKTVYHTSLANVDWLHGTAESLLTITNLLIVLGLRQAIMDEQARKDTDTTETEEEATALASQQSVQSSSKKE